MTSLPAPRSDDAVLRREWAAHYLDGQAAVKHPATIRLLSEGLEVTTPGWSRIWPYRELRQTQGAYEGEQVRLERGGDLPETLVVPDQAFLASLAEAAPHVAVQFHGPPPRWRRVRLTFFTAAAILGILAALYFWGIPLAAALIAPHVPVAWEERLGRSVTTYLAPEERTCRDPVRQQALDAILDRLVRAAPRAPYRFRVVVVNQPQVNALAAPGGTIVLFRGLLERTGTPEELAGVLAHEVEHVLHRHATRAVIQHASTGLLVAAITGDMTGPVAYGLESARVLGQLQYSRRAEEEADREGLRLLLAARVDPQGMMDFYDLLAGGERDRAVLRYLSTHPSTRDRVSRLRDLAAQATGPPIPLLPDRDWREIRSICAPLPAPDPQAPPLR